MGGVLLAQELKQVGIPVLLVHPGFNRTGMTAKYSHIWDIEGAVHPECGAMRVLHERAVLVLVQRWGENFYHWLSECVGRLALLAELRAKLQARPSATIDAQPCCYSV